MNRKHRRSAPPGRSRAGEPPPALLQEFQVAVKRHQAGQYEAAEKLYTHLLGMRPGFAPALHYLGVLSAQTGRHRRAVELILKALEIEPDMPNALNHLGVAYYGLAQYADARDCYRKALAQQPGDAVVLMNLANLMRDETRYQDADRHYREALSAAPAYADAIYNYGISLLRQLRLDEAAIQLRRDLELRPGHVDGYRALGLALMKQERVDEARECFQRALQIDPRHVEAIMSLATLSHWVGDREEALKLHRQAVAIEPGNAECHYNLAVCQLAWEELRAGFAEYEWRWRTREYSRAQRPCRQPLWDGSPLAGQRILVWREQGVGDEILHSSMIPGLLDSGARLVLECDPRLAPLFARSFPSAEVVAQKFPPDPRTEAGSIVFQSPIAGLARWLRHDPSLFPRHEGYLRAEPRLASSLREKYLALGGGKTVIGISWSSRNSPASLEKGTQLTEWRDMLANPNAFFVNLQYGDCASELEAVRSETGVTIYADPGIDSMRDLDAFAAQVRAMDLVISTSNTTVHFAGAQNVPCWTLLPSGPGALWYWFTGREDSPWYPSMRLFRRRPDQQWRDLLARVASALAARLAPP
jgi:Tfp pilus assembly protein PilF